MTSRCYLVDYRYLDGESGYTETCFIRGSEDRLERYVGEEMANFAGKGSWRWTAGGDNPQAVESTGQRVLSVDAEEVDSLDGLPRWRVTDLGG